MLVARLRDMGVMVIYPKCFESTDFLLILPCTWSSPRALNASIVILKHEQFVAMDLLVLVPMKNAAKCDM
jgi:hypothetical protein